MEANFYRIFSRVSHTRNTAFAVIKECVQQLPFDHIPSMTIHEQDIFSTLSVLGRPYDLKGGDHDLHLDSAKKLIGIMGMISARIPYPRFFSKAGPVKVLPGIFSQHGVSRFDEAVECMFQTYSESLYMTHKNPDQRRNIYTASDKFLRMSSDLTLIKFLPGDNETFLSAGKALCLKAMVGTFIWKYGSENGTTTVWACVFMSIRTGNMEAIHASLALKIIAEGSLSAGDEDLGTMFKAIVPLLNNAQYACNSCLFMALCKLLTTILANSPFIDYLRGRLSADPSDHFVRVTSYYASVDS
jgi:hypothetical protein